MELLGHCQSPEVIEVIPCSLTSSQAAATPEQDTSHLQLLSNELLSSPQPDGTLQVSEFVMSEVRGHRGHCMLFDLIKGSR